MHDTHIRNINTHVKLYISLFLPLAQITPLTTPNIQHKQPPILINLFLSPLWNKLADENTLDPIIEFTEAVDSGLLTGFPATVFAVIVVLSDGLVDGTTTSSLEFGFWPFGFALEVFAAFALTVRGGDVPADGPFELAGWGRGAWAFVGDVGDVAVSWRVMVVAVSRRVVVVSIAWRRVMVVSVPGGTIRVDVRAGSVAVFGRTAGGWAWTGRWGPIRAVCRTVSVGVSAAVLVAVDSLFAVFDFSFRNFGEFAEGEGNRIGGAFVLLFWPRSLFCRCVDFHGWKGRWRVG
jgi:hypothetical protein